MFRVFPIIVLLFTIVLPVNTKALTGMQDTLKVKEWEKPVFEKGFAKFKTVKFSKKYGKNGDIKTGYAFLSLEYPDFTAAASAKVLENLKNITDTCIFGVSDSEIVRGADKFCERYFSDYKSFKSGLVDQESFSQWELKRKMSVDYIDSRVICLKYYVYHDIAEMHENREILYMNFDLRTGQALQLEHLLKPGSREKLEAIAEKLFRKLKKLKPDDKLEETEWFAWTEGKFALNNNFTINAKGIVFYYNNYEIASYADGPTELFIPYGEIKDLLSSNYYPLKK